MRAVRTVNFFELSTVRREYGHEHINAALIHHCVQDLTVGESDLIGMKRLRRQLTLNGLAHFEQPDFFSFLLRLRGQGIMTL